MNRKRQGTLNKYKDIAISERSIIITTCLIIILKNGSLQKLPAERTTDSHIVWQQLQARWLHSNVSLLIVKL